MFDFKLIECQTRRDDFTKLTIRARLDAGELLALGDLQRDPYSPQCDLDLWVEASAILCATRLDGPATPDVIVDTNSYLYEIRAFTRLVSPTEAVIHELFEREVTAVQEKKGLIV